MGELVPWGEWRPDVSPYQGEHSPTITNVIPRGDGYGPINSFSAVSDPLTSACRGFFTAFDDDNTAKLFAGTSSRLWLMSNSTFGWGDVSKTSATELDYTGSTNIGNATNGGGLAAAFDGTTAQAAAACAAKTASTSAYVGKTLASSAVIRSVNIYGSNDAGYVSTINPTVVATLYGKTGSAPSSGTDGTAIGNISFTDTADEHVARTITCTDPTTYYLHVWVNFTHNGAANQINVAELEFFSASTYSVPSYNQWQFGQFSTRAIAVASGIAPQSFVMGSSSVFADLAGSPPQASYITTINEFVVLSGLTSDPFTIQWSSRSDPTEWIIGTNEGDSQTFVKGGMVRGVAGGEFGLVFQDNCIRRMTYQPGSPLIFSFDVISEDLGLLAPYSLVQQREFVFFLSPVGFYMWHPMQGFKAIGKERVDRTFFADCDINQKHLIIAAPDPDGTRIMWAYKSTSSGLSDQFDRIICYDWALDRWAGFIDLPGEYIATSATPGVTLENLDAISSSIDALEVSLDSFPTDFGRNLAMANSDHEIGQFTGDTMEATLETGDIDAGRRVFIRGARPITDAVNVLGSTCARARVQDEPNFGAETTVNATGFTPHRQDTRIARFRNRIPGGESWTYSMGVEPDLVPTGER